MKDVDHACAILVRQLDEYGAPHTAVLAANLRDPRRRGRGLAGRILAAMQEYADYAGRGGNNDPPPIISRRSTDGNV